MVGDTQFADVRFVAEGRAIMAHRFVLESRCEYFRAMFRHGLSTGATAAANRRGGGPRGVAGAGGVIDVVVPDTFIGFLRFLIFLYTDSIPDGSDNVVIEDLMSADRYNMPDLKSLCESMLVPSKDNWIDLLHAADLIRSKYLQLQVVCFLRDNMSVLNEHLRVEDKDGNPTSLVSLMSEEFPWLLPEVLDLRKEAHPRPPSEILIAQLVSNHNFQKEKSKAPPIPWWALLTCLFGAFAYAHASQYFVFGDLAKKVLPLLNVVFSIAFIYFFMRRK